MKRMMALAMVAVSAPALVAGAQAAPVNRLVTGAAATPMYMNAAAPIDRRVNDLLSRMTLQEKIGQMDQIVVGRLRSAGNPGNGDCNGDNTTQPQPSCLQRVLVTYNTGSILSGGTDDPPDNTGHGWANLYNTVQRYAIQHSRLHIPIIYGVDAVHGYGHRRAPRLCPAGDRAGRQSGTLARQVRRRATAPPAVGRRRHRLELRPGHRPRPRPPLGPLLRDFGRGPAAGRHPRRRRGHRHPGRAGQADVASTVKHFAGYGEPVNGHDRVPGRVRSATSRTLCCRPTGRRSRPAPTTVMTNAGAINRIPAYALALPAHRRAAQAVGLPGCRSSATGGTSLRCSTYHMAADYPEAAPRPSTRAWTFDDPSTTRASPRA